MTDNAPSGGKSTATRRSIAQSVCHDCDNHEEIHRAHRPADAKQMAIKAAIEHGRATGHEVTEKLISTPRALTTIGPDVADTEVHR
jgi:hypothetical protein